MAKTPEYPPLKPGWKTGSMRSKEKEGNYAAEIADIRQLREELVEDLTAQITQGDRVHAEALVEEHLVGTFERPGRTPSRAASPDAQRIIDEPEHSGWKRRAVKKSPPEGGKDLGK